MGDKTKIEWTDATWNPIRARDLKTGRIGWHCEHASEGCRFCYAEGFNNRLGTQLPFKPGHRQDVEIFVDLDMLTQPLRWKRPRTIFVCSMTDLGASFVTYDMLDQIFGIMAKAQQHTFQILTKRPDRLRDYILAAHGFANLLAKPWPLPNVWIGTSVEDQANADVRIPQLLAAPAALHFLSCEPLLGPIDIRQWLQDVTYLDYCDAVGGPRPKMPTTIRWVICGGESGRHARPMHPDWARALRDQCAHSETPFHFKQWGEWLPAVEEDDGEEMYCVPADGGPDDRFDEDDRGEVDRDRFPDQTMWKIGKRKAGRLLDGVEHDAMPGRLP